MNDQDLKSLWQSAEVSEHPALDVEEVALQGERFERKIRRRNLMEWAACIVVAAVFGVDAIESINGWELAGNLIIAFGAITIGVVLWRKGQVSLEADPSGNTAEFLGEHAHALEVQARLLEGVPLWYLLPLGLGILLLRFSDYVEAGEVKASWLIVTSFIVVVFVVIGWMNVKAAQKMRQEARSLRQQLAGEEGGLPE